MTPTFPANNGHDSRPGNAKVVCQCSHAIWRADLASLEPLLASWRLMNIAAANLRNVSGGQLVPLTPLDNHVSNVLLATPKEQVFKVDAWRVVAPVTDVHAFWYGAVDKRPNKPVGKQVGGVAADVVASDKPIPALDLAARPCDAIIAHLVSVSRLQPKYFH